MTAPIVHHMGRQERDILRAGTETSGDVMTESWRVPGQLWSRIAEGRKQVWS